MAKYINPFVDFGFKYIFGREESKPFLIDFLNSLLCSEPGFSPIVSLEYLDKEKSRGKREARGVIYDIHCETSSGKRFTVEMQNQSQAWFFDRMIYYVSKAIVDQGNPSPTSSVISSYRLRCLTRRPPGSVSRIWTNGCIT